MLIPIVDENDTIITYKERSDIAFEDIYRITCLIVVDESNKILITRRALTKKNHPGVRTWAVAGTVEKGETYDDNIIKETQEEINLLINEPVLLLKHRVAVENNYFISVYIEKVSHSFGFVFDTHEVMDSKWLTIEEIDKRVNDAPQDFAPGLYVGRKDIKPLLEKKITIIHS